jgi:hypothetical protein
MGTAQVSTGNAVLRVANNPKYRDLQLRLHRPVVEQRPSIAMMSIST